ncbi:MAG: cyclic nucleotide-binding domain-containing protein [Acidobacteriota bacterium]
MRLEDDFIVGILENTDIFGDLTVETLRELGSLFDEKIFNSGEIIFEENNIGNSMMVITSGEVRVSQDTDSEGEEALIILKKGDLFGEMALLEDLPRTANVIAHTNVILLEINREKFLSFLNSHSDAGIKILLKLSRILSSRLRETDTKLKAFISLTKWL